MLHTLVGLHMHTLLRLKIIYNSKQNPRRRRGFAPKAPGREPRLSLSACRRPLVDPRQLLHDLNDFVHGGLALHAAAVVDLEPGDRKC